MESSPLGGANEAEGRSLLDLIVAFPPLIMIWKSSAFVSSVGSGLSRGSVNTRNAELTPAKRPA